MLTLVLALVALILVVIELNKTKWTSPLMLAVLLLCLAVLSLAVRTFGSAPFWKW